MQRVTSQCKLIPVTKADWTGIYRFHKQNRLGVLRTDQATLADGAGHGCRQVLKQRLRAAVYGCAVLMAHG